MVIELFRVVNSIVATKNIHLQRVKKSQLVVGLKIALGGTILLQPFAHHFADGGGAGDAIVIGIHFQQLTLPLGEGNAEFLNFWLFCLDFHNFRLDMIA